MYSGIIIHIIDTSITLVITAQLNNGIEFSMEFIKNTKLGIKHIMLIKYQNELLCL